MSSDLIAALAEEVGALRRSIRRGAGGVRRLARGLLLAAQDAASEAPELQLDPSGTPAEEALARSVLSARSVAWVAVHFASFHVRAESLVMAALLADAGRFRPGRSILAADDARHPLLGAALVGGLVDAPTCLSQLVARHHERSDGTGFPEGLAAFSLAEDERLLAAAVRFAELWAGVAVDAARQLHEEARQGAFDAELTANLWWSITGELPVDGGFGRPAPRALGLTDLGRRRLRLDDAHPQLSAPHFGTAAAIQRASRRG